MLGKVVEKLKNEKARAILIIPHWTDKAWFGRVQPMVKEKHFYPKGTKIFEQLGGDVGEVQWHVWALLVDGSLNTQSNK